MPNRACVPGLVFLALGMPLAEGQQSQADDGLEEIVVSAARQQVPGNALPNRFTLIDRDALEEQLAISTSTLDAIGSRVPSFSPTRQKLSGFGESMRGREPLYMIDGVPQSNPLRNGSRDGFTLDPAVIERVEVLYGANAIQGIGATGGIVNYVTRSATDPGLQVEIGTTATDGGDDDGFGFRAAATSAHRWNDVDLVVSVATESRGAFYDAAGRRIGIDNVQGDLQDSRTVNGFGKLGWRLGERTEARLMLNAFEVDGDGDYVETAGDRVLGLPTSAVRGVGPGEPPLNEVRTMSFDVTHDLRTAGMLTAQVYRQQFESVFGGGTFGVFQDPALAPDGELFDQSANHSRKHGAKLTFSRDDVLVDGLTATAGIDYLSDTTYQSLIHTGRNWVPETEFVSIAPFVQLRQAVLDERLSLSGGVRVERMGLNVATYRTLAAYGGGQVDGGSPDFDENLVNFGVSYDATDALTLYASYAEGFTVPDVGRVLRGVTAPDADVDTLLDLEPIVADNTELGVRWRAGRLSGDLALFRSESDFGQRLQADADGIFSVQRERTEIEGFEVSGAFELNNAVDFGLAYARLDARYDSDGDGAVDADLSGVNVSPDRINASLDVALPSAFQLRLQASAFLDRSFDDAGDDSDFAGYTLVDAVLGWELARRGRLDLAFQNLLDEQYISYYSQTATSGADDYYAGRGRTITLRWSGNF